MASQLNPLVLELYFGSLAGEQATQYFATLSAFGERVQHEWPRYGVFDYTLSLEEGSGIEWKAEPLPEESVRVVQAVKDYASQFPTSSPEQVEALLKALVTQGQVQLSDEADDVLDTAWAMEDVQLVSLGLHLAHPDTFVPYGFKTMGFPGLHQELLQIAAAFDIPLPVVAAKNDTLGRWLYFGQFSAALQAFRQRHDLTVPGLLAVLYHFGPLYVQSEARDELPAPRHAWLLVGNGKQDNDYGALEAMTPEDVTHWQGSLDMQRGDVCVMYVRSPVKEVHSLLRVMEDAYVDPFFHYKHAVQIGEIQRVPRIPFQALKADPVFGASSHIGRNLQGTSGQMLSSAEYNAVLNLLATRGLDLSKVPRLAEHAETDLTDLSNERDVEVKLVEPLLRRLGLTEKDWIRQLPVRMGRGERNYPDYAIGVTGTHPEQRVHALVEVKYRASGELAWKDAFQQAMSYGMRLGAQTLLLAAADGVRFYQRRHDQFTFESGEERAWSELRDDVLLRLGRMVIPGR
ncbi:type I restriction enzyme HsdR N-terminal domain-containing protein [Deinococcus detaillensis]|uniref:Type I restriction enzyme HsdR N-terminal domain-containing protein n=1 Tax=Deinococcus detaillensis TaxID=2592048 RepID=A0A553UPJ2_9DEIO|nr:type I restriction enzyme HsdR N-terminal domain-containing protein [Deinococcus detaillensis]TSA82144.1 type I restriction enzyme HsdR N-terminal domain-containing protein [Deinococcus detaillensis]